MMVTHSSVTLKGERKYKNDLGYRKNRLSQQLFKVFISLTFDRYMFRPSMAIFTAHTETGNIRQTQVSCPYGGIGVQKASHR
jgi:hypothetical protein